MSRTATKLSTLPLVKIMFTSVEEEWFRKYVTDVLGSVHNCYVGCNPDVVHAGSLKVPTEPFEASG